MVDLMVHRPLFIHDTLDTWPHDIRDEYHSSFHFPFTVSWHSYSPNSINFKFSLVNYASADKGISDIDDIV